MACRRLGVSEQTFYCWKKQCSGLGLQELREFRSLRHINATLKQVVADQTLDRHILQRSSERDLSTRARKRVEVIVWLEMTRRDTRGIEFEHDCPWFFCALWCRIGGGRSRRSHKSPRRRRVAPSRVPPSW